ncbi:MAG: putative toxin-antitoxin system toxin component, PIN family [Bacteroidales bacterium]
MKIVLDTNVFVSSFFGGNPKKIINLWKSGRIVLCLSADIIDEYVEVLGRLGLADEKEIEELLRLFRSGFHLIFTHNPPEVHAVDADPDDDKFFACAAALGAEAVIPGDSGVVEVKRYGNIRIYTPGEFLKLFE